MKSSVIVSVYNRFEWLRLVLDALRMQSVKDFEVVLADDGSNEETLSQIADYISVHRDIKILHYWHPDEGWRKNIALNGAVRLSSGEHLIFLDGDCIPHPKFVEDHQRLVGKGKVITGRRITLPPKVNSELEKIDGLEKGYFRHLLLRILKEYLKKPSRFREINRMVRFPIIRGRVAGMRPGGILGCNFSLLREDFMMVNGFDERYLHPATGEDSDINVRLISGNVKVWKVTNAALLMHRNHPELFRDFQENRDLLEESISSHVVYTPYGINKDLQTQETTKSSDIPR